MNLKDINKLAHNFIDIYEAADQIWKKCTKCNIYIYSYDSIDYCFYNLELLKHANWCYKLTCDEVVIKNIIE